MTTARHALRPIPGPSASTRPGRWALLIALLVALFLAAPQASAAKKWKGRFAPRKGTVHRLLVTTDVAVSAKLPLIGGPEGRLALEVETTRRVAQRRRRGPTSIELTIDRIAIDFDLSGRATRYDSAEPDSAGDATVIGSYAGLLLGRVLTVVVLPTGEVVEVSGVDDLYDELERLAESDSSLAPLLDSLTRDLGSTALKGILQQATPVLPGGRLRTGAAWSREADLPNPLFESMHAASDYALEEIGVHGERKAARTVVRQVIRPEGQGPLLEQLARLAGIEEEVRLSEGEATGTSTIWSERKTGLTLALELDQRIRATLSIPIRVLGFSRRTNVPLKVDQRTTIELLHTP